MAGNGDILEVFEMVGTIAIDMAKAFGELASLESKGQDTAQSLQESFEQAFRRLSKLNASPDIEVDSESALNEIKLFQNQFQTMLDGLEADASIDFNTDPAVQELKALRAQADQLERSFSGTEGAIEVDGAAARQTLAEMQERALALRETLKDQKYAIQVQGQQAKSTLQQLISFSRELDGALNRLRDRVIRVEQFITENVERIIQTTYTTAGDPGVLGPQVYPSGQTQANGPPDTPDAPGGAPDGADYTGAAAAGAAAAAGMTAAGNSGYYASRRFSGFTYDLERADRALQAYHQRMLRYALQLNPQTVLKRAAIRLDVASDMFKYFPDSKNMLMLQATFSAIEQGALAARKQLSQLGFGRTKTEIKAIEGQMHTMANIRLDTLRDNIKLTEKALKEMKQSANADEFVAEMAEAERALKRYKAELAKANPVDVIAKANGYKATKLFGKDVIYKPFDNAMDALRGRIVQFVNRDLAYLQNKTYESLDNAAKAIVGKQTTKAEEKAKIGQLAMKYQMLGQQLNTFVTPAVLALAGAFGLVAANAQKGWGKFEAQTLTNGEDMKEFKNIMADTAAATGSSIEEVGELFSVLKNQMGRTKENIRESAEWGLQFKKVWGVDAVEAVAAVDSISKDLGVTQKEATDILALAMKKHQGDIKAATKDVETNEKAWKKNGKTMTDGMTAYEKMVSGIDDNGIAKSEVALRKMGNSLLELWKALEPTVIKLADAISAAADKTTEFLRNNPGMATFLAHLVAIGGAGLVLIGVLAPIAGFLLMNRGLFQALGQALGVAGKGMAVMSPQARMLYDNLILTRNAVAGLPRMFRALGPGLLSVLRGLPGMVGGFVLQFIRMNPILSGIAAISWVIYKNWDRFEPVIKRIWEALKRIGNTIVEAFAGPGKTGAEGFGIMMDKLAYILGTVLLPVFEVLATVLEGVAALMETGAGKYLVYAAGVGMLTGTLGKMIPGLGLLSSAFGLLTGKAGKASGAVGLFKKAFSGIGGAAGRLGPLIGRALGGIGGVLVRFGSMLLPLLANPWVLAGAAIIAAIVGIGVLIYKNWDKIVAGTKKIFSGIGDWFSNHWKTILAGAAGPIGWFVLLVSKHWDDIVAGTKKAASAVGRAFKSGLSKLGDVFSGANLVKGFTNMWRDFKASVGRNLRALNKTWSWQFNNLWKALGPVGGFLKQAFTGIFKGIPTLLVRFWTRIGQTAINRVKWMGRGIVSALKSAAGWFTKGWEGARRATAGAFRLIGRVVSAGMKKATDAVSGAWRAIGRFFSSGIATIRRAASTGFAFVRRVIANAMSAASRVISGAWRSISRAFSNAIASIRRGVSAGFGFIRRTISNITGAIARNVSAFWSRVRRLFTGALSAIRRAVSTSFTAMRRTISNITGAIARNVSAFWGRVRRLFTGALSALRRAISAGFNAMRRTISDLLGRIARNVSDFWSKVRRFFTNALAALRRAVSAGFNAMRRTIADLLGRIARNVSDIWSRVRRTIANALSAIRRGVAAAFSYVYTTIRDKIASAYQSIKNTFGKIGSFFKGLAKSAFSWGSDVIGGVVSGIIKKAKSAYDAVANVGKGIAKAFKKAMGIASPSKIMRVLSYWIPVGAAAGIEDGIPDVTKAADGMAKAATPEFDPIDPPDVPDMPGFGPMDAPTPPDMPDLPGMQGGAFQIRPEVVGNPLDIMANTMRANIRPRVDVTSTINTASRVTVDQEQKAQVYNVQKLEPHIHVQQLATPADYAKIRRDTQRYMVDETNKEVNRRQ